MPKNRGVGPDGSIYPHGEERTAGRMQDEPWYSDYQCVLEVVVNTEPHFEILSNGLQLAIDACEKAFDEAPGPSDWERPTRARITLWVQSMFENIQGLYDDSGD